MSFQTAFLRLSNEQKSTEDPSSAASPITKPGTQPSSEPPVPAQPTTTPAPSKPASSHKAAITTHVLNQVTGRPASRVRVRLHNDSDTTHASLQRTWAMQANGKIPTMPTRLHIDGHTDSDGRLTSWENVLIHTRTPASAETSDKIEGVSIVDGVATPDANTLLANVIAEQKTIAAELVAAGQTASAVGVWHLVFETGSYFHGETMWNTVDLALNIDPDDERGHWHVPLLLGPWGYTTYRGS